MLGALESRAITRQAALHAGKWQPIHSAILAYLKAHHNRRTGECFPDRDKIAAFCNVHPRTVDRQIARLRSWGLIEPRQERKRSANGTYEVTQYKLLFDETPGDDIDTPGGNPAGKAVDPAVEKDMPRDNPCDKPPDKPRDICAGAIRKEAFEASEAVEAREIYKAGEAGGSGETSDSENLPPADSEMFLVRPSEELRQMHDEFRAEMEESEREWASLSKGQRLVRTPTYTQRDFDERDWRKLNQEINMLRESNLGLSGTGGGGEERFKVACQRAGISVRRGYEIWEKMMA
jgi:hypothetical protein